MLGLPNYLDQIMKTLAERLRYAMEILPPKKIKGVDLARAVGVKPPSVSDWLSGKSKTMEGENLLRVAKYLNVNPVWLATGKDDVNSNNILLKCQSENLKSSSRSQSLEKLINTLDELEQKNSLNPETIEVLLSIALILSQNKSKS